MAKRRRKRYSKVVLGSTDGVHFRAALRSIDALKGDSQMAMSGNVQCSNAYKSMLRAARTLGEAETHMDSIEGAGEVRERQLDSAFSEARKMYLLAVSEIGRRCLR